MSERFPGGFITNNPTAPTTTSAPGIWTLDQATQYIKAGTWPFGGPFNYIEDVFSTYLYTGTGATQTITNGVDLSTYGGLVWVKDRTSANDHALVDTVRGAYNTLKSNTTDASASLSTITGFNTTGFNLGGNVRANANGDTYVSWTLRKQPKFFDIVTFSGNGSNRTISHNLGSTPGCIFVKCTSQDTGGWQVYHRGMTSAAYSMNLNGTSQESSQPTVWNSTAPTSTVFSVGTAATVNQSGDTYVAYLFAHNAGGFGLTGTDNVISCGSLTTDANGAATVNLGYEPQFVIFKSATSAENWYMSDVMRGMYAPTQMGNVLYPSLSNAEAASVRCPFVNATGMSWDGTYNYLAASQTYIYIAIRRGPMKTPTSGTSVYNTATDVAMNGEANLGFPADMTIMNRKSGGSHYVGDRLRGNPATLITDNTNAETTVYGTSFSSSLGFLNGIGGNGAYGIPNFTWAFRRAPGFFDEVCGTSTATANQRFNHNLGVAPEIIISKNRTNASNWFSYWQSLGRDYFISLNSTSAGSGGNTNIWGNTNPTTTDFGIDTSASTGFGYSSGSNLVFYLFASCPGVSKVGSYTGNGSTQTISCGFAARFVMIKQTSAGSGTDWWVWDTARGMVAGTDPRLALNSTAAETNANWVYTDASGFQIVTSDAAVNASTKSYIFLAIA